ncbi:hypothetical protein P3342_000304 [Pyrenophora teres f. teres]|nr:hypothetical protein P3342_000304 [Pyrenophora teres f. teres]
MDSTKNTRWGNRSRQTSLQTDGHVDAPSYAKATPRSRPATAQNTTAQSFILPDLPNLTELVSGVFGDGTPVFSRTSKSRFAPPPYGGRRPSHIPIKDVPTPDEEKAIYSALQQLQDKVAQMEEERAEQEKKIEEQDLELIELRATAQAHEKLRRSDSAQDSDATAKSGWKVEKTRLDGTLQTLRTKLDRTDRKCAVLEIEKKRLSTERDNMAAQLRIAFQTCEEVKNERTALSNENEELREEIETLRAENESLRDQLEQDQSQHREEIRVQQDENTQQLTRKDSELQQARQDQAQYARLKSEHDSLRAQISELKAKREEDVKRWSKKEATLRAQVDRRDDTIQGFRERYQNKASEAMLQDNENLRNELQELQAQLDEDYQEWEEREAELQRKIRKGDARRARDVNNRNFDDNTAPTTRVQAQSASLMSLYNEGQAIAERIAARALGTAFSRRSATVRLQMHPTRRAALRKAPESRSLVIPGFLNEVSLHLLELTSTLLRKVRWSPRLIYPSRLVLLFAFPGILPGKQQQTFSPPRILISQN